MYHIIRVNIICAGLILLTSCYKQEPPTEQIRKVVRDTTLDTVKTAATDTLVPLTADTTINSFARILAGLTVLPGHERHAQEMQARMKRFADGELVRMRTWASSELTAEGSSDVVFYPFSGPDALNVLALYPNAKHYVMIAAEPAGSIPKLRALHHDSITTYLQSVVKATRLVYGVGYFITDSMRKDIRQTIVDGAVPLISLFVSQMGNTILGYDRTKVQSNDSTNSSQVLHDLYFRKDSASPVQRLTYIEANLGNNVYMGRTPLPKNSALRSWLAQLPRSNTFVKSASYLMHNPAFSFIRAYVLRHSLSILQDDSGVPYAAFDSSWKFRFYGRYERPISQFSWLYQEDLDSAIAQSSTVRPGLPFRYGYLFRRKGQNVMKAYR